MKFCDQAFQLATLALQLMQQSAKPMNIIPLDPDDHIRRFSNCPEMVFIAQAADLLNSAELYLNHNHAEDPAFFAVPHH